MIHYNSYDLDFVYGVEDILEHYGIESVTDSEVWDEARKSQDVPNFENILIAKTVDAIEKVVRENHGDKVESWHLTINARASCLQVNGHEVLGVKSLFKALGIN